MSGSSAESFLGCPPPHRAAGDKRSEFLQCEDADAAGDERGRTLEAFRWGNYTSGSARNAFWLLLLPFGVINAAQFMIYRPRTAPILAKAAYALASAILRLLGLALTLLLVFGVTIIATDLVAWQALDQRSGWILAATALAPVVMLAFLIGLGREDITKGGTKGAKRGHPRPSIEGHQEVEGEDPPTDFRTPGFYAGNIRTPHLWVLHVAGSLAFLWWILGGAFDLSFEWGLLVVVPAAATVLIIGDPAGSAAVNRRAPKPLWRGVLTFLVGVVAAFSAIGLGRSVLDVAAADPVASPTRTLPGIDEAALVLMGSAVLILAIFAFMCLALALMTRDEESKDRPAAFRRYAAGNLPSMVAAVATFLAVGLTAAVILVARATLNGLARLDRTLNRLVGLDLLPDLRRVEVPQIVERAAYAWGLTFGVILVLGGLLVAALLLPHRRRQDRVVDMFKPTGLDARLVSRIARWMFVARLKNRLVGVLAGLSVLGLLLALAAGLEMSRFTWQSGIPGSWLDVLDPCDPETAGCRPSNALGWLSDGDGLSGFSGPVMWLGVLGLGAAGVLLFVLGLGARHSPELLRKWSIGWDVIAFWPRSAHPGVPPPYSLRVVGDLADRIRWHLCTGVKHKDGSTAKASYVVLCGHSQGSLISFATLLALDDVDRARVGFVSFGSQLRLIFPRAFPSYVNYAAAKWLMAGLRDKDRNDKVVRDRWVNLFRETDPLAGPVLSWDRCGEREKATSLRFDDWLCGPRKADEVDSETGLRRCGQDWRLLDPRVAEVGQDKPKLRKHGDFFGDPAWPIAVSTVSPIKAGKATEETR